MTSKNAAFDEQKPVKHIDNIDHNARRLQYIDSGEWKEPICHWYQNNNYKTANGLIVVFVCVRG